MVGVSNGTVTVARPSGRGVRVRSTRGAVIVARRSTTGVDVTPGASRSATVRERLGVRPH